jgi:hypothetical protein
MSDEPKTIATLHGRVDRAALERLREEYDTTRLLRTVDELAGLLREIQGEHGWREQLLALHVMAHTVINDAGFMGARDYSLPELAQDLVAEMQEAVDQIEGWIRRIGPLEELAPEEAEGDNPA